MELVTTVGPIALLLLLILIGTPIALALGASGAVGILLVGGIPVLTNSMSSIPFSTTASYSLILIPMFIFMGACFSSSGMLSGIFEVAQKILGRLPGGLGIATVGAATFFGGITGSSVADAATLGRLSISEMRSRGYEANFAAATVAASATIAVMIPPSLALVIYGIIAQESIGRLLLAGVIPGLVTAVAYALYIGFRMRVKDHRAAGGRAAMVEAADARGAGVDRFTQGYGVLAGGSVFTAMIGGLYLGVFTAIEAGAIAAFLALVLTIGFIAGRGPNRTARLTSTLRTAFGETGGLTAMIFLLIIGAAFFTHYLVLSGIPQAASNWALDLPVPPSVVVMILLLFTLPMGMFIDGLSLLLIVTPVAYPIISALGFDGIVFGILLIKFIEIGLLTPPVGLNVFVVAGLFPWLRAEGVFRAVLPFVVIELFLGALFFLVPEIVLFLPDLASPGF